MKTAPKKQMNTAPKKHGISIRAWYTDDQADARIYTSDGRAHAAAKRLLDPNMWRRIVELSIGRFAIDTMSGYVAK